MASRRGGGRGRLRGPLLGVPGVLLLLSGWGPRRVLGFECEAGRCINCMSCYGSCDSCSCLTNINTCCCWAPPGYYTQGTSAVPCVGGTYQDESGSTYCKQCPLSDTLYYVNSRAA